MSTQAKKKNKPLRYFFYNGDLQKKIHINRGADVITSWNYPKAVMNKNSYSDVKRNGEKAFSTREVSGMLGRSMNRIKILIETGEIPAPQHTYGLDENRNIYAYYWREQDIMDLHEYYQGVHIGRPRNDGQITPKNMPTAAELRAIIRQGTVFYVKDADGNFVPTWDAEKF